MELTLNLIWLAVAATTFIVAPKHDRRTWLALLCGVALLFPIISASDDMSADRMLLDVAAALLVGVGIVIGLIAIARVRTTQQWRYAVALSTPSDPRSPPAR